MDRRITPHDVACCDMRTGAFTHLIKALIAEFIGTFALVFIGAGAVVALDPPNFAALRASSRCLPSA